MTGNEQTLLFAIKLANEQGKATSLITCEELGMGKEEFAEAARGLNKIGFISDFTELNGMVWFGSNLSDSAEKYIDKIQQKYT